MLCVNIVCMRKLSVVFIAVLVLVGCSTDEHTMQLIDRAERVMIEHPDSALNIVRSIDVETIRGEEDMAYYRLAMAEACYYNRIAPSRDSIAQPLFDYYLESDDHAKRARALYQHALVMQSEGENAKAMYSLMEVEKSLEHVDNPRLEGLMHRAKGDIYSIECLFNFALEEHEKAKNIFEEAGLYNHANYALFDIALVYNNLRNYNVAIDLLLQVDMIAKEQKDHFLRNMSNIELCLNYIQVANFESCVAVFGEIEPSCNLGNRISDYYCIGAILQSYNGDTHSADEWLLKAKQQPLDSQMRLNYAEYVVCRFKGNSDEALEKYMRMIEAQDENVFNLINNSLLQSQVRLIENERVLIAERAKLNKICLISVIVVLLLVIVAILLYMRYHNVKKSRDIANYISIIAELEQSLKSATKNESSVNQNADIIELNKICEIYYQYGNTSHLSSKIIAEVSRSIESIKTDEKRLQNLENIVNLKNHNVLSEIIESCPKINNKEYRYIIYNLLGFSSRSMAMLLDIDTDALARLKYKVKVKLRGCENAKIKDLIV